MITFKLIIQIKMFVIITLKTTITRVFAVFLYLRVNSKFSLYAAIYFWVKYSHFFLKCPSGLVHSLKGTTEFRAFEQMVLFNKAP